MISHFDNLSDELFDEFGQPKKIKRDISDWEVFKQILRFIGKGIYRRYIGLLITISIVGAFLGFITPFVIRNIIQDGLGGGGADAVLNPDLIYRNVIYISLSLFLNVFIWYGEIYLMQSLANSSMYEMRKELFDNLQRLSFDYYEAKQQIKGKIISYVTNDVETIQELVGSGLLSMIGYLIGMFGSLIIMFTISWQLTLVTFSIVPIMLIVAFFIFKNARRFYILMRRKVAAVTGHLNESISGMKVIKAFAVEERNYYKFDLLTDAELSVNIRAQKLFSLIPALMIALIGTGLATIIIYGSNLALNDAIGIGDLLAFVFYLMGFLNPLMAIFQLFSIIQNSMAAGERIIKLINIKSSVTNQKDPITNSIINGDIEFSNVNFEYEENQPVINNFNLKINRKERIAIIGYTGAGKTTLINLLERFYDVNQGNITIDGKNIKEFQLRTLRSQIGLVLQDNLLFSDSVKNNIRFGKPNATDEEIIDVSKKIGAHQFIMDLPHGYDTEVREFGNLLSVGQKQLIAFARALLIDPPILIMDEATSAIDPYSELIIQDALETLLKDRTSITIAHRLSTVINADRIVVMEKGKLIEEGKHSDLMKNPESVYNHLFLMQFKDAFKNLTKK